MLCSDFPEKRYCYSVCYGSLLVCQHYLYTTTLEGRPMSRTLILILLILVLLAVLPTWPYSSGWGYYPSGTLGLILLIVIILVLLGYL